MYGGGGSGYRRFFFDNGGGGGPPPPYGPPHPRPLRTPGMLPSGPGGPYPPPFPQGYPHHLHPRHPSMRPPLRGGGGYGGPIGGSYAGPMMGPTMLGAAARRFPLGHPMHPAMMPMQQYPSSITQQGAAFPPAGAGTSPPFTPRSGAGGYYSSSSMQGAPIDFGSGPGSGPGGGDGGGGASIDEDWEVVGVNAAEEENVGGEGEEEEAMIHGDNEEEEDGEGIGDTEKGDVEEEDALEDDGSAPLDHKLLPFDPFLCEEQFTRQYVDESALTQLILKRHQEICPNPIEQAAIANLVSKVHQALERIVVAPESFTPVTIEEIREVGSFKKGTMLTKSNVADIVVILRSLPTMESVNALGQKIVSDLKAEQNDVFGCVTRDYGCEIAATNAVVRLLITILPKNARLLDPVLHLAEAVMQANMAMIRHARWFDEHANQSSVRILIKVLKDIRRRNEGLKALDIWAVELLAHHCVVHTPTRQQLPLAAAFRRFFQVIAAGMLMPHSPSLPDPCDQPRFIHQSLTYEQMDNICSTAQTLLRVILHGGAELVLGLNAKPASNVCSEITILNGVVITPLEKAYDPAEMPQALLQAAAAANVSAASQPTPA